MIASDKTYSQSYFESLIGKLRMRALQNEKAGNKELQYEVFVDGSKLIDRTDDPELLDLLDENISEHTETLVFKLYNNQKSNRNLAYILRFGGAQNGLGSLPMGVGTDGKSESKTRDEIREEEKEKLRVHQLEKKNELLEKDLKDLQRDYDKLELEHEAIVGKSKMELIAGNGKDLIFEGLAGVLDKYLQRNP